ncbi:MAG: hypothetical protein ABSG62_18935, partial [Terracidiphilus sp.]
MLKIRREWGVVATVGFVCVGFSLNAQSPHEAVAQATSRIAGDQSEAAPRSASYRQVQERLARGWNTWDVHSVATHVLLPEGLAIHVGIKHNSTLYGDAFLGDALIGRLDKGA